MAGNSAPQSLHILHEVEPAAAPRQLELDAGRPGDILHQAARLANVLDRTRWRRSSSVFHSSTYRMTPRLLMCVETEQATQP
jgi:hypothetical protein